MVGLLPRSMASFFLSPHDEARALRPFVSIWTPEMSTASCQTEKESAMRTASQNGDILLVRRLLDELTNPNCADLVRKI